MPLNRLRLKGLKHKLANPSWLAFVWFGVTAGISLLETPVKFTAPTITRAAALDVGRVVFGALNKVELALLILLLVLVRVSGRSRELFAPCAGLVLILVAQSVWLLPELSARAESIVHGVEPGASIVHGAYSVLELAKLLLLLYVGFKSAESV
ncbi:MAG TPA: hypothetical protein VFG91_04070 [Woeseiaceae bacterium]|nr:hypothetical protein [Woeseiaceae bacterium]